MHIPCFIAKKEFSTRPLLGGNPWYTTNFTSYQFLKINNNNFLTWISLRNKLESRVCSLLERMVEGSRGGIVEGAKNRNNSPYTHYIHCGKNCDMNYYFFKWIVNSIILGLNYSKARSI